MKRDLPRRLMELERRLAPPEPDGPVRVFWEHEEGAVEAERQGFPVIRLSWNDGGTADDVISADTAEEP